MSVKQAKKNFETRISPYLIGRRYQDPETRRHQEIIRLQKLTEAHKEEIKGEKE